MPSQVNEIHIFPVHGEAGVDLRDTLVEPDGLAGDRRKKAPVQVVAAEDVRPDTRANLVVSLDSADLAASIGKVNLVSSASHAQIVMTASTTTRAGATSFRRVLLCGLCRKYQESP